MVGKAFAGVKSGNTSQPIVDIEFRPTPLILAGQFEAFAVSIRSYREPLKRSIQQVVIPSISKNFDAGGRPAWTELAPATIARRLKEGSGLDILNRTGKGKRAALALARWMINIDTAVYQGNFPPNASYMPIHQLAEVEDVFTGPGNQSYLPGRVFASIQDDDQRKIEEVFRVWLGERARRTGVVGL